MNLNDFVAYRMNEKLILNVNGYENGDPETNGEISILKHFKDWFNLFIDVGANIGGITKKVLSLNENAQVICFEANPSLSTILLETFSRNNNVQVEAVALSNESGDAFFFIHPVDSTVSSLFKRIEMMPSFTKQMKAISIKTVPLNDYIEQIIAYADKRGIFIKVDAEGSELPILIGGDKLLKLNLPIFVMFEYSFAWQESGQQLKRAFHYFDEMGFNMYRITPLGLEKIRYFTRDMDNSYYCNYFATRNCDISNVFNIVINLATKTGSADFYPFNLGRSS